MSASMARVPAFSDLAQRLPEPLILGGIALLLLFGFYKILVRSGILRPISRQASSKLLLSLVRYGFVLALVSTVLGFALAFNNSRLDAESKRNQEALRDEVLKPSGIRSAADLLTGRTIPPELRAEALRLREATAQGLETTKGTTRAQGAYLIALVLYGTGQLEDAQSSFSVAVEADPGMTAAYVGRAATYQARANLLISQRDWAGADAALKQGEHHARLATQQNPKSAEAHTVLGYIHKDYALRYEGSRQTEQAEQSLARAEAHFQRALATDPESAAAHNGLGNVHLLRGEYDKAIEQSMLATKLDPSFWSAFFDLALAYYRKGEAARSAKDRAVAAEGVRETILTIIRLDEAAPAWRKFPAGWKSDLGTMAEWVRTEERRLPRSAR